jgi:flagellin
MALSVNTNVSSLNAQRHITRTEDMLKTALERLSSGLRINSARDDAAGLAISDRMYAQVRGLNQGIRNANDGISLVQTGEAGLQEYTNILQRLRELAVQSANATNTADDRGALDKEYQQLVSELERIATQTTFNGNRVLNGSMGSVAFQVGANVGDTITIGLSTGVRTTQVGQIATQTGSAVNTSAIAAGNVTINGVAVAASVAGTANGQSADSAWAKVQAITASGVAGVTATAVATEKTTENFANGTNVVYNASAGALTYTLTINGVTIYSAHSLAATTGLSAQTLADKVNLFSNETGVSASVTATSHLQLSAGDGRNIVITQDASGADVTTGIASDGVVLAANAGGNEDFTTRGTIKLSSSENITLGGDSLATIGFAGVTSIAKDSTTINSTDVTTVGNAETAIDRVDAALASVSSLRSTFGAIQNRMQSAVAALAATSENLAAARARILDADFAAETAELTKAQILQQAGVAMLAQANALPQLVLALLSR